MRRSLWGVVAAIGFLTAMPVRAEDDYSDLFHLTNESELGYTLVAGNADSETFHIKQTNGLSWNGNRVTAAIGYLRSAASGTLTARWLTLNLRYERRLIERLSVYGGPGYEINRFAGYDPRYYLDAGFRYLLIGTDAGMLATEVGYRYLNENRVVGGWRTFHLGRAYLEGEKKLQELLIGRMTLEVLPNFSLADDVMVNGELSLIVRLSAIFSLKWAYTGKFRNVPAGPGLKKFDSQLTGALLAKF